jgi:hypothetical protein
MMNEKRIPYLFIIHHSSFIAWPNATYRLTTPGDADFFLLLPRKEPDRDTDDGTGDPDYPMKPPWIIRPPAATHPLLIGVVGKTNTHHCHHPEDDMHNFAFAHIHLP